MQAGPAFQLSTVLPYPVPNKQLVQGGSLLAMQRPMLIIWMSDVQKSKRECNGINGAAIHCS